MASTPTLPARSTRTPQVAFNDSGTGEALLAATDETIKYFDDGDITGTVIEVVKGGLILDIGLRGFLPASLVEMRRVRDLQPYVGRELEAKIIELDKNRNNVVLSRRQWLEQTQSEVRSEFLNKLAKGQVRTGVVSSIVNFGAFVDLGGVDGLVHVSELSWKDIDLDRRRISLSLKQANEGVVGDEEQFDPAAYGMAASYDEQGNYIYPEGFDPETGEWLEGYEEARETWERQYAEAQARFEAHRKQIAAAREADAEAAAGGNYSSGDTETTDTSGGTLASDEALAALRAKLAGGE